MHFAPDTDVALRFVAQLGNTDPSASPSRDDELATVEQLMALLDTDPYTGRRDRDLAELEDVRRTRTMLREAWQLDRDALADAVNVILRDAKAMPQLVRHDGYDWHLHATDSEAPLAERIRVEAAMALIDVVRLEATDRLRVCVADDCEGLLVDFSRNGSKRFCSVRCSNRMNQIAFRERQVDRA